MKAIQRELNNRSVRTTFRRYECKYLVPAELAAEIRAYARPYLDTDPFAAGSPDRSYDITSLYLDSPDLKLYRETEEGQLSRIKLRIRSYDEADHEPVFLEIKRRFNNLVFKDRARIERSAAAAILAGQALDSDLLAGAQKACYEEFVGWLARWLARPMVWVRYRREAYVGTFHRDLRVTMDRKLVCAPADRRIGPDRISSWRPVETRMVVLEVKFDESYPDWVARLVQRFELERRSYSKYGHSVRLGLTDRFQRVAGIAGTDS